MKDPIFFCVLLPALPTPATINRNANQTLLAVNIRRDLRFLSNNKSNIRRTNVTSRKCSFKDSTFEAANRKLVGMGKHH